MHIFFSDNLTNNRFILDDKESLHLARVLRLKPGDIVEVINGSGTLYRCEVIEASIKGSQVEIREQLENYNKRNYKLHIAIAPTKNMDRFEFFVEKSVELGIDIISPIICDRSERKVLKTVRSERIILSAMKQSRKTQLSNINEAVSFSNFLDQYSYSHMYIAHCNEDARAEALASSYLKSEDILILIGPEGDFSPSEVELAKAKGYRELSLGTSRLRTETAGLAACSMVYFFNQ